MVESRNNGATSKKSAAASDESNPYIQRMNASAPEKKCFVKIVAIGDSGVGKTSVI